MTSLKELKANIEFAILIFSISASFNRLGHRKFEPDNPNYSRNGILVQSKTTLKRDDPYFPVLNINVSESIQDHRKSYNAKNLLEVDMLVRAIHDRENPYVVVNKSIITDKNLSWKAKGIWLYAFSRPDDWVFYVSDIINQSKDSTDSVNSGLKELEDEGYLIRERVRNESGQFKDSHWTIYEIKQLKEKVPQGENPILENPIRVNPGLLNNEVQLSKDLKNPPPTSSNPPPSSRETKKEGGGFFIYECLKTLGITEEEKIRLTKMCIDESRMERAVQRATIPGFSAVDLVAVIFSNYKSDLPEIVSIEKRSADHKLLATIVEKEIAPKLKSFASCFVYAENSFLELVFGTLVKTFDYEDIKFKMDVLKELETRNLMTPILKEKFA